MAAHALRKAFSNVHKMFFPRWDLRSQWRIRFGDLGNGDGNCDFEQKEITISTGLDRSKLTLVLIHEVAHAVTRDGTHEKKWKARMEKATQQAEKHGQTELADALRAEVMWYQKAEKWAPEDSIEDCIDGLVLANPAISLDEVLAVLSHEMAGMKRDRLLALYPQIEKLYEEAKYNAEIIG